LYWIQFNDLAESFVQNPFDINGRIGLCNETCNKSIRHPPFDHSPLTQPVFLIREYILQRPIDFLFNGVFANRAIGFGADAAGKIEAAIGMHKEFNRLPEFIFDERA
jgi:hypothetical protein